jgi:phosphomannomutase
MIEERNYYVNNKDKLINALKDYGQELNYSLNYLDGISGEGKGWHFNLRPSNNPEPIHRLNLEAKSKNTLSQKTKQIEAIILKYAQRT